MMPNLAMELTPQAYLVWERQQKIRHEFVDGETFAMAGASRKHNLINVNVLAALHAQLRGLPCELYNNDMRVKIHNANAYVYPDIVVACDELAFADAEVDTLLNPLLIIEILSDSTASYDRGTKFKFYRTLPSLQQYILIAQHEYCIECYTRQANEQWLFAEYRQLEDTVILSAIDCALKLQLVYERIVI